jgi:hypothetical protein
MSALDNIRQVIERRYMRANSQIRLIEVGIVDAIPAEDVQVGMVLMLNYGATYDVVARESASKRYINFKITSRGGSDKGRTYDHKRRDDSLMAAYCPEHNH